MDKKAQRKHYRMRSETRTRRVNGFDPTWRPTGGPRRRLLAVDWESCPYCGKLCNPLLAFDGPEDDKGRTKYCRPDHVEAMKAQQAEIPDSLIDYLLSIMPEAQDRCANCGRLKRFADGVTDDKFYCSDNCHGRGTALLVKPESGAVNLDGYDV